MKVRKLVLGKKEFSPEEFVQAQEHERIILKCIKACMPHILKEGDFDLLRAKVVSLVLTIISTITTPPAEMIVLLDYFIEGLVKAREEMKKSLEEKT
jgi:hypothetical protein